MESFRGDDREEDALFDVNAFVDGELFFDGEEVIAVRTLGHILGEGHDVAVDIDFFHSNSRSFDSIIMQNQESASIISGICNGIR